MVDARALPNEHDLERFTDTLRVTVDVLCHLLVKRIILCRNVCCKLAFEITNLGCQSLVLDLQVSYFLEELQTGLVSLECLFFETSHVLGGLSQVLLHLASPLIQVIQLNAQILVLCV